MTAQSFLEALSHSMQSIYRSGRVRELEKRGTFKKGVKKMPPSLAMLLKTNGEKIPAFRSVTMLMKTGALCCVCHDVDESTGGYHNNSAPVFPAGGGVRRQT
jgi:hypothetical protein